MAKLVSATYAEALFELALEQKVIEETVKEVESVKEVILQNDELMKLLNHPQITRQEKVTIVENVFKSRVSDIVTGLLVAVVEKGRSSELVKVLDCFLEQADEYRLIGTAYVTSAIPLSDNQKKEIESKLKATTKYMQFKMNYIVDKDIIGGLVIRIGDRIVDSSIRTKLNNMSKELLSLQIQ